MRLKMPRFRMAIPRRLAGLAAATCVVLLLASVAGADVLILTDGTRLEGVVRKTPQGYSVTAADGTVTNVAADEVAGLEKRGETAGAGTTDVRLESLRRSVSNLSDLVVIISKYEAFIAQNPNTDAAAQARADLEQWRDFQARGLVKHGSDWLTAAERERRLRDAFLEVSDARMQIKQGELDKAQRTLARLLDANPDDVSALYLTAVLELRQGEVGKARANFEKVRAQVRKHAPTLVNLAAINMDQDRHQRALTFLAEAMASEPGNREILDNVAEALNLLPPKLAETRQAEQVRQLFLSQDAALRQRMAQRGLYRWGSTWVDQDQLEELQAMEAEIKKRLDALSSQYARLERDVADIDQRYENNRQYMQRLEANRTYVGQDGKIYQAPLPPSYYETERDQRLLVAQREETVRALALLEQQAAQERTRYPTPPYRGQLAPIGEDGVPVPRATPIDETTQPETTQPSTAPVREPGA